jgi:UDP-N-acetylmuramate: L-alanyl-gamma-D-glutamyl-meso-diaminopimelate ligase
VKKVAESATNPIRKLPYSTPNYKVENGITLLETPEGDMPIEVFGAHNLNNLAGAKWICQNMGVDEAAFYEAIASFKGASKRLEKIAESKTKVAYKDFAHSPSKVAATTKAVKEQFPNRKLVACLELHTYSSLNAEFLKEYEGALEFADVAVVFYSPDAVKIKQLEDVTYDQIAIAFNRKDLIIYTNPKDFKDYLFALDLENSALLLMSSGNYGGLNFDEVKELIN